MKTVSTDASRQEDLERVVEPVTRGDPASPLRWTGTRVRPLAKERSQQGHQMSHQVGSEVVHELGYRFQAGCDGPFEHRTCTAPPFLAQGDSVISVDATKKERVGDGQNNGRAWHPHAEAEQVRVWKGEIQKRADETGWAITSCPLPPGTCTGNTIDHRRFSVISQNGRGKPVMRSEVMITQIAATTTTTGRPVPSRRDTTTSLSGRNISDDDRATVSIQRDDVHGEWNSTMLPRPPSS